MKKQTSWLQNLYELEIYLTEFDQRFHWNVLIETWI